MESIAGGKNILNYETIIFANEGNATIIEGIYD
jgi:hypothetical protein